MRLKPFSERWHVPGGRVSSQLASDLDSRHRTDTFGRTQQFGGARARDFKGEGPGAPFMQSREKSVSGEPKDIACPFAAR